MPYSVAAMSKVQQRPAVTELARALFSACALLDPMRLQIWDRDGLTVTQLRLLSFLNEEEGLGNADLADRLYVTRPSVSALLERLERGDFIRREIHENDRRSIRIWLTDRGRAAVAQLHDDLAGYAAQLFDAVSDSDLSSTRDGLQKLVAAGRKARTQAADSN